MASPESIPSAMVGTDVFGLPNTSSSLVSDSIAVTFTVFPKLPMELQLKIWKKSLPGPRHKIKVFAPQSLYDPDYTTVQRQRGGSLSPFHIFLQNPRIMGYGVEEAVRLLSLCANVKSPGVLFACRNSRSEALHHYTKCLNLGRNSKKIRFDPTQDTVFITHMARYLQTPLPHMAGQLKLYPAYDSWLEGVETLALSLSDVLAGGLREMAALVSHLPTLKTLILIMNLSPLRRMADLVQSDEQLLLLALTKENYFAVEMLMRAQDRWASVMESWKNILRNNASRVLNGLELKPMILSAAQRRTSFHSSSLYWWHDYGGHFMSIFPKTLRHCFSF
ncbi:hypothetical protein N431DRAFT_459040 [Stipitochalara longipes BDJ]|nr:hypothetical protein N431DRAFT_459040 [Stipitochalara longipes BDJ]